MVVGSFIGPTFFPLTLQLLTIMGEYIGRNHDYKIGTCENMYYCTWKQALNGRHRATYAGIGQYIDNAEKWQLRWRLPFPDEKGTGIGQYHNAFRHLRIMVPIKFFDEQTQSRFVTLFSPPPNADLQCEYGEALIAQHGVRKGKLRTMFAFSERGGVSYSLWENDPPEDPGRIDNLCAWLASNEGQRIQQAYYPDGGVKPEDLAWAIAEFDTTNYANTTMLLLS